MRFYTHTDGKYNPDLVNRDLIKNRVSAIKPENKGILWGSRAVDSEEYLWFFGYQRYKNTLYVPEWFLWDIDWTEISEDRELNIVSYDIDLNSDRVLVIDSYEKFISVRDMFPLKDGLDIDGNNNLIDWEKLSKEYDACYVDYHKVMSCGNKFSILEYGYFRSYDCDTIMVFNTEIMKNVNNNDTDMESRLRELWLRYGSSKGVE